MSKFKLTISKPAQRDLANIYNYTLTNWGENQFKKYSKRIDDGFKLIIENPQIGKARLEYYSLMIEQHIIFYKIKDDEISIVRILHKKMDFDTNF